MAWNRSVSGEAVSRPLQKRKGFRFSVRGALGGAIVVIGAAVAVWWIWPKGDGAGETPPHQAKQRIKEAKPSAPRKTQAVVPSEVSQANTPRKPDSPWRRHLLKLAEKDPQLMFELTNRFERTDKRVFGTTVEQALDWMFNCKVGDEPMPLLGADEEEPELVERILKTFNEVKDDDSESVADRKDQVMRAKVELAKFLKDGGEYKDFMRYYHDQLVHCHQIWLDAQDSVENFTDTEASDEEVMAMYDKVNKMLVEQGIRELEVSDKIRDRLGLPEPDENGNMPAVVEILSKE